MINTTYYLVNGELIKIPNSSDPIVTIIDVTEKEINLIKAMRSVVSQDNTYEVHIITKSYPGKSTLIEYYDTFKSD